MQLSAYSRICKPVLLAALVVGGVAASATAIACPFCSAVSQTLRQEMAAMDAVVIAEAIEGEQRDEETGEVALRVVRVLKGDTMVKPGEIVRSVYYGTVEAGRRFMLSGVEPSALMWSSPLPLDERAEEYLGTVLRLTENDLDRLRFYYQYLQDDSSMLARDAYDEFAITPYPIISQLKPEMNHDQLVEWIKDPEMPADRRRLYLVMLGICGSEKDVPMLESMVRSTQKSARTGLDSLVACYLTLAGRDGLKTVDELFLSNKQAPYADTYAAIMAIRFHGTETDVIDRAALVKSLHQVLDRPDLADLVIPDLARWSDWTVIDRLVELFKTADADNNWLRVPVVNYMRACPLPEAAEAMEVLKEIDPEAVKRANTYFSTPVPPADSTPSTSSQVERPTIFERIAQLSTQQLGLETDPFGEPLAQAGPPLAFGAKTASGTTDGQSSTANRMTMLSVLVTAAASLMIIGYLVISGGAQPSVELVRVENR